jgi:hypothetical protein
VWRVCFEKRDIPILIAKESFKFSQSCILLLIAPREFAVLEVDLFKVTIVEGISESHSLAPIGFGMILVSSSVDLVEVTGQNPSSTGGRFLHHQAGKQSII